MSIAIECPACGQYRWARCLNERLRCNTCGLSGPEDTLRRLTHRLKDLKASRHRWIRAIGSVLGEDWNGAPDDAAEALRRLVNLRANRNDFEPDYASPPGETIQDMCDEKKVTPTELAARLDLSVSGLQHLLKGDSAITWKLAQKLEANLGGNAKFWMTREAYYRERLAVLGPEKESGDVENF